MSTTSAAGLNPLFLQVAAVYQTRGVVVITHAYDKGFRAELTFRQLALAAKGDVHTGCVADVNYVRLWREVRGTLIRRGHRDLAATASRD